MGFACPHPFSPPPTIVERLEDRTRMNDPSVLGRPSFPPITNLPPPPLQNPTPTRTFFSVYRFNPLTCVLLDHASAYFSVSFITEVTNLSSPILYQRSWPSIVMLRVGHGGGGGHLGLPITRSRMKGSILQTQPRIGVPAIFKYSSMSFAEAAPRFNASCIKDPS